MRYAGLLALVLGGCGGVVVDDGAGATNGPSGQSSADGEAPVTSPVDAGAADSGGACVMTSGPAFVTPREPTMSVAESCAAPGPTQKKFASEDEVWSLIVGTWIKCSGDGGLFSHAGFVIAGDRAFRYVDRDPSGALRDSDVVGRIKVIPNGPGWQIDVERFDRTANFLQLSKSGVGDKLILTDSAGGGVVARAAPGSAAKPTSYVDSGACSLEGTWDSLADPMAGASPTTSGTFRFDGRGHFVGGERGSDICHAPTMQGTYRLVGDTFEIVTSEGMGCPSSYASGWSVRFSPDCGKAFLASSYDNCTGGRHSIAYSTTLTQL